jgi:hypothetical protein
MTLYSIVITRTNFKVTKKVKAQIISLINMEEEENLLIKLHFHLFLQKYIINHILIKRKLKLYYNQIAINCDHDIRIQWTVVTSVI